ncbi:DUF1569 domain-containing protein [Chryseobacterium defluvii]|uniref:Uncharacterized protein DUF1569 n=1 Tax=Chryseobacterium defluvii TaxID=160396 RepID=A0A495SF42_9FLAO|nr:DUF1569 domain-containing protein [Chryseobacterium defluvii]RKS98161.1 uncharacterized protein DUF1569 [Chryseobacterium defluvii]
MVKKTLHHRLYFEEILERISGLSENSQGKWGKMNVSQMLKHCDLVLQIPLNKIELSEINFLLKWIGICTKREMYVFNNGIPRNMPTFQKLIVNFDCDFNEARSGLLQTMEDYWSAFINKSLPEHHMLFGKMNENDWGFLEFKHLDHHLKQFNV